MAGRSFLLIDERELLADEVTRRRRRIGDEPQGLTSAQKQIWNALHFLLHRRAHGYREGYCSYAEIAEFCGLAPSTVVAAIGALVAADLLLKRRRRDPRGRAGKFYAPNAYWLLPPPSVRTEEETKMVEDLKALWGEDERLPPRRRPTRQVPLFPDPSERDDQPVSEVEKSVHSAPPPAPRPPAPTPAEDADRQAARELVAEFHRAAGLGTHLAPAELELARELIGLHGEDAVRELARFVLRTDKPRSFVLLRYKLGMPHLMETSQAPSILSEALGVRIEALGQRIQRLQQLVYADATSPLVMEVQDLADWLSVFAQPRAFGSEELAAESAGRLEAKITAFEGTLGV